MQVHLEKNNYHNDVLFDLNERLARRNVLIYHTFEVVYNSG
jgi:hypothetical protein